MNLARCLAKTAINVYKKCSTLYPELRALIILLLFRVVCCFKIQFTYEKRDACYIISYRIAGA
jgi:hypothetical protein